MKIIVDKIPERCSECIFLTVENAARYTKIYRKDCALKRKYGECLSLFAPISTESQNCENMPDTEQDKYCTTCRWYNGVSCSYNNKFVGKYDCCEDWAKA